MPRRPPAGSRPSASPCAVRERRRPHPAGRWTRRSALALTLALVGAVAPFEASGAADPTIALRFFDDNPLARGPVLGAAALRELQDAAGFALAPAGRDIDGAFLFRPAHTVSAAQLRAGLGRLRASGAVIYAEALPAAKRPAVGDARPATALLVRMTPAAKRASRDEVRARVAVKLGSELRDVQALGGGAERLVLPRALGRVDAERLAAQLASHPEVLHVEVERRATPQAMPADPLFPTQWNLLDPVGGINAPGAWQTTAGDVSAPIAILDTGMLNHPELSGRALPGYDLVAEGAFAGDGDGRDADPSDPGDFVTPAEASDPQGALYGCAATASTWHGTMVAGVVGAGANDGVGLAPVNWRSPILNVRVMGKCGGALADIADGIRWAAGLPVPGVPPNANAARVINLSLSGQGACGAILQSAVTEAIAAGAVVVAAAGNDNADVADRWPANCRGVIAVGGSSRDGSRSFFSNHGSGVAVSAPAGGVGGSIQVLRNSGAQHAAADGHGYGQQVGTSLAAPHVAGAVSLVQAVAPELTPAEIRALLEATARPAHAPECATLGCGAGIVDAAAAVASAAGAAHAPVVPPPEPRPTPPPSPPPSPPPPAGAPQPQGDAPPPVAVPVPGGWSAKDPQHLDRIRKAGIGSASVTGGVAEPAPSH